MSGRVIVVDDEKNITFVIQAMLERAGIPVLAFNESAAALRAIEHSLLPDGEPVQAVVTDLYMPGPGGMDILQHCQTTQPHLPVVLITAYGTVESAVAALKAGAFDYVTKPFDQTELVNVIRHAVATYEQRIKEPVSLLRPRPANVCAIFTSLIGRGTEMQEVFRVIGKIAPTPATVLIHGESGTGKELVAQEIHRHSSRADKPFLKINCAAIPPNLIESELFGYERGAFTGAVASKPGRFELAHEGTLFLDEVGEMPLEMQVKLLRVLQEQSFERVGGVETIQVDVRILTATNRDLEAEVRAGRFREDLYYRLNVVPIKLPPLRDRREDIDLLLTHFTKQLNEKLGKSVEGIEPACLEALRAYAWPGNIRQLENAMERMMVMSDGPVLLHSDLPEEIIESTREVVRSSLYGNTSDGAPGSAIECVESTSFRDIVKKQTQYVERELIERALEETRGNVTRAAERLGLSRKGLQLKIKELGLKTQLRGTGPEAALRD